MKFVLFILAVLVLLWLVRGAVARRGGGGKRPVPPPAASPQAIVACAQCGVHLPRDEALPGQGGVFCGAAHRAAFEKERAAPP
ncbi:MAG: PP0621 family protein [Caldimonas sp.]